MWRPMFCRRWIQLCLVFVLSLYLWLYVGRSIIKGALPVGVRVRSDPAMRDMTELRPRNQSTENPLEFWGDLSDGKPLDMLIPPQVRPELTEVPFAKDPRYRISECPTSLRQRANTSAWFGSRFVEDVKLFLDQDDINPAYWTEHLTYYRLPFGYRQENKTAVDLMVGALKNPEIFGPSVTDDTRGRCMRCAVVGSGGVMRGSKRGTEIDGHDYVFRVNHANMQEKFADDVGRKISFYTFYPESHEHDPRLAVSDSLQLFIPFKSFDIDYMAAWLTEHRTLPIVQRCRRKAGFCVYNWSPNPNVNQTTVKVLHPDFIRYAFSRYLNTSRAYRPTTGFLTAVLALQLCDHVSVYGFGYDARFPLYYFDDHATVRKMDLPGSYHNHIDEQKIWKTLHQEGIIYWYNRQNETLETARIELG